MRSKEHDNLTISAITWLSNKVTARGIRATTELPICQGYIADAGAIAGLQESWSRKFFKGNYFQLKKDNDWPDVDDYSFIFESKVSRSDFRNTFVLNNHDGDRSIPKANFHFVVTEKDVITNNGDVPIFWGILERRGSGLTIKRMPAFCPHPIAHIHEFAYSILRYTKYYKYSAHQLCQAIIDDESIYQHPELLKP